VDKETAYEEIGRSGGEAYARDFAARHPDDPLTPFCLRYLFDKDQQHRAASDSPDTAHDATRNAARDPAQDGERGFALKSLARMESSAQIAHAAASASRDAATAAQTSARAARRSSFWTMIAAIASALGVVVNAALNLGWLDWARHLVR
jgi:hypothetical protein